jgi:hypothetical protein
VVGNIRPPTISSFTIRFNMNTNIIKIERICNVKIMKFGHPMDCVFS